MKHTFLLLTAAVCLMAAACKKNKEKPQQPDETGNEKTVQMRFRLSGDILVADYPLPIGRQVGSVDANARLLRDTTLYAVMVRRGTLSHHPLYSSGMFAHPDSIVLDLPVDETLTIIVRAFRKGSSGGIHYIWQNGRPYFENPTNAALTNKMDTLQRSMQDTLSNMKVTNPLDSNQFVARGENTELDVFYGKTTIVVTPALVTQSLQLKRISFGVQLAATGFTTGKLLLEFPYESVPFSITPAENNSKVFIIASEYFKDQPQIQRTVTLKWQKPDGNVVILGTKQITFKRNILTKIQVTMGSGINLDPVITETDWTGSETVTF